MRKKSTSLAVVPPILAVMGCWLLFVASFSSHELALGAGSTVLTAAVSWLAWRNMTTSFSPTFRQVIAIWRLPWYVLSGTWEMFAILLRDLGGKHPGSFFRATKFQVADGREGTSQIVLATGYTTVAPNFIVVGVSNNTLLFHQIEKSGVPRMIRDIEAPR